MMFAATVLWLRHKQNVYPPPICIAFIIIRKQFIGLLAATVRYMCENTLRVSNKPSFTTKFIHATNLLNIVLCSHMPHVSVLYDRVPCREDALFHNIDFV